MLTVAEALNLSLKYHREGKFNEADRLYREILKIEPDNADALHLLGVLSHQTGNNGAAMDLIGKAVQLRPGKPDYRNNLGEVYRSLGRLAEAERCYRHALSLRREYTDASNNLGLVLYLQGRIDEALKQLNLALQLNPVSHEVHNNLGLVFHEMGHLAEAKEEFQRALSIKPDYVESFNNLGNLSREMGNFSEAVTYYNRALGSKPHFAEAINNLGVTLQELDRLEEAIACYRKSLALKPAYIEALNNLAMASHECGLQKDALAYYAEILRLKPGLVKARWGNAMAQIPLLYDLPEEIGASRERYRIELESLAGTIPLDTPQDIQTAAKALGTAQPYYLAYQGQNDRDLQSLYGDLVCRIQALRYPQWSRPLPLRVVNPGEPLRVGIVSRFFCYHSVWKMRIRGWLEQVDRSRFHLYGYFTGRKKDEQTELARQWCHSFKEDFYTFEDYCRTIEEDDLHVLIYPEVGMDPTTLKLASLRLAPVQCASWSHPETSGLPTIDYFLGSDLMEPPDADDHYRERLVRLPNLGVYYVPPETASAAATREDFGLRPDATVYLCAQFLPKYLPQYDEILPRIAAQSGNCQFVFLSFPKSSQVTDRFRERLSLAFRRLGLDSEEYVVVLPYLDAPSYKALNRLSDVFLDAIGWSGMNTTLEAIEEGLPVVTLPGRFMRERHTFAVLTMMDVKDTVASTADEYVDQAVRLARDPAYRRHIALRTAERRHRVYQDGTAIRALEEFLRESTFPSRNMV